MIAKPIPPMRTKTMPASNGERDPCSAKRNPASAGPTTKAVSSMTDSSDSAELSSFSSFIDRLQRVRV